MSKYTLEQYNEAKSVYENIGNYNEVARRLEISPSTIQKWLKTDTLPMDFSQKFKQNILKANKIAGQRRTKKLLPNAKRLTPTLAYILGVIEGDGCINGGYPYRNRVSKNYSIKLNVVDQDFAEVFKKRLEDWSGMKAPFFEIKYEKENWNNQWGVQLYSNEAALCLKSFDVYQIEQENEHVIGAFLKGFYDSEGGIYFDGKRSELNVVNTNHQLMELIEKLLRKIGINKLYWYTDRHRKSPCYRISIRSRKEIRIFAKKVGFSIKRKSDKLEKIVTAPDMRGKWSRKARKMAKGMV